MNTVFNKDYTNSEAIINPTDFTKKIEGFPRICISTFSKKIIDRLIKSEETEIITGLISAHGEKPVYRVRYRDTYFAFYLSAVSSPASAAELEEIIAMGAEKVVFFGSCGILNDELVRDSLIIPTGVVRDEGTSYHYIRAGEELVPDEKSTAALVSAFEKYRCQYVKGRIWTTDAIYRETKEAAKERKEAGCIAVEMEYSALLAVARYRNIGYAQFFYGADSLDNDKWEIRDLNDHGLRGADKYIALAFECGLKMQQNELEI